jgi:UDP-N-acetylmuramate dehydrogenase
MYVQQNISLQPFNTFHISETAQWFARFDSTESLQQLLQNPTIQHLPKLALGGGSNILFTKSFKGVVLKNEIKGIEKIKEDNDYVYLQVGAGEHWHQFVQYCVQHNWGGVENLSLIPGCVGAAPIQNIGAYGVEVKDVIESVEAYDVVENKFIYLLNKECSFGYRDSIFKYNYKHTHIITSVIFRLHKYPIFNIQYGAIQNALEQMQVKHLSIQAISEAVIHIRQSKLPDPAVLGNAGSFFKNPTINIIQFKSLQQEHPTIVGYPTSNNHIKIAAGWLIEQCGWKGYRKGNVGCYEHQALVVVNYGNASGQEVYDFSENIIQSVQKKFGILLEREVNTI